MQPMSCATAGAIRNAAEIIRGGQTEPRVLEAVEIMQRQLNRMVRMVDDLMDISRI